MKFDPSQRKSFLKQALPIAVVLVAGLAFGGYILSKKATPVGDEHGREPPAEAGGHAGDKKHADEKHPQAEAAAPKKGPHGGRLFAAGDFGLELTIFETGVQPQFRIYTTLAGKPIDPARSKVVVTIERLGRKPQTFTFSKEADYLKGAGVVEEPHSFAVSITAGPAVATCTPLLFICSSVIATRASTCSNLNWCVLPAFSAAIDTENE